MCRIDIPPLEKMRLGFEVPGRQDEMLWHNGKLVQNQSMGGWKRCDEQSGRGVLEGVEGSRVRLYRFRRLGLLSEGRRVTELELNHEALDLASYSTPPAYVPGVVMMLHLQRAILLSES